MLSCLLFGAAVMGALLLVPLVARIFQTVKARTVYAYTLLVSYVGSVLWLTLINRIGMGVSQTRFRPFFVLRQMAHCWLELRPIATARCHAIFKNSTHLLDSAHATPVEDLCLNIILFMPLGFLLPYVWPKFNFWKTVLISFLLSATIETTQYVAKLGCCDIDDIINNILGTCIGYACYRIYTRTCHS